MSTNPTITEFLEARIAEDKEEAEHFLELYKQGEDISKRRWLRILREAEAKQAIIKQADEASSDRSEVINEYCVGDKERADAYATDPGKLILEAIAAIYRDHPDYQQEWVA